MNCEMAEALYLRALQSYDIANRELVQMKKVTLFRVTLVVARRGIEPLFTE